MGASFREKHPEYLIAIQDQVNRGADRIEYIRVFQLPNEFGGSHNRSDLIKNVIKILAPATIQHINETFEQCPRFGLFFAPAILPYSILILDKKALYYRFGKYDEEVSGNDKVFKFIDRDLIQDNLNFINKVCSIHKPVSKYEFDKLLFEVREEMTEELRKMESAKVKAIKSVSSIEYEIFSYFKTRKIFEYKEEQENRLSKRLIVLQKINENIEEKKREIEKVSAKEGALQK